MGGRWPILMFKTLALSAAPAHAGETPALNPLTPLLQLIPGDARAVIIVPRLDRAEAEP